jgi:hypothetical protein
MLLKADTPGPYTLLDSSPLQHQHRLTPSLSKYRFLLLRCLLLRVGPCTTIPTPCWVLLPALLGAAACAPLAPKYTHNTCITRSPLPPAHPALPAAQGGHPQDVARLKAPFDTPEATNPSLSTISAPAALTLLLAVETSRITPDLKAGICFQGLAAAAAQTPGSQMETPAASMPASQRRHIPDLLYSNPLHHTNYTVPAAVPWNPAAINVQCLPSTLPEYLQT